MLWRKKSNDIIDWIHNGKDALLVTGARQIGKTYLIKELLKKEGCDFVSFDLIDDPEMIKVLESISSKDSKVFLERLSIATNHKLIKGKTIIFFDEIQEYKEIVTKIKYLVSDGSFKYVLSGSLLGVELVGIKSAPVGYMRTIEMYPMDFYEFCVALGLKKETLESLKRAFDSKSAVDPFVHERMIEAFKNYLLVGGMPDAVKSYVTNGDFNDIIQTHKKITEQYKKDFSKYDKEQKLKIIKTYELIPAELADKNKRYFFADIDKDAKYNRYENSFNWLIDAGVALPVFNISEPRLPIEMNKKNNVFKLFLSDVGMLTTMYGKSTQMAIINSDNTLNAGAIYENVVAQELKAHGYKLYYFNSHKQGELDFVVEHNGRPLPIEVKSGKDYARHNALTNVLANRDYDIRNAFVFSTANVSKKENITYYPIYMLIFLEELIENETLNKIDLSTL